MVQSTAERKEYQKNWRLTHPEYNKEYRKEYNQTSEGRKSLRIATWKNRGIISEDFVNVYKIYIETEKCMDCDCILTDGPVCPSKRVLDHCHVTGEIRAILCFSCNVKHK